VARSRTSSVGDVSELTRALDELVAAIDQARSLGLAVKVPDPLYQACRQVVARHEASRHAGEGREPSGPQRIQEARPAARGTGSTIDDGMVGSAAVRDVPLRRLIWQVLDPGEEFTVSDVADRLAELGAPWPANKVSNALGYWVSRQRLDRQRKGVYRWPITAAPVVDRRNEDSQREIPAGNRASARRKEVASNGVQEEQRKAM
jgi:hypothetical protein